MTAEIHDPVTRTRQSFRLVGESLVVDCRLAPGGALPAHYHPLQEERWSVLDGEVRFRHGDRERVIGPGDGVIVVAPGEVHGLTSSSDRDAHLRCSVTPPLRLQQFLEEAAAAGQQGLFTRAGRPRGLRGARWAAGFLERYRDETVMLFPPAIAQRVMIALLARGGDAAEPRPATGRDRLASASGVAVPTVLTAIAGLHAAWALGWYWPAGSEGELAGLTLASGERERLDGGLPPAPLTALVALGLAAAAAVVRLAAGGSRSRAVRGAGWGVAGIFLARGLVYPPLDLVHRVDDRYDRLDLAIYSPLCLAIGSGTALVLRHGRPPVADAARG